MTLFPKSPASASLVSFLMDMKYSKGVPLYRIEQSMKQEGILFPRNTYARWMIDCSDRYLEKIYAYMHEKLLEEDIIYVDETHYDVFTEGEKGRQLKQIYIWMFRTGVATEKKIVLYVHKEGRSGKIATEFLKDHHGYLQSDDYAGYNGAEGTRVFCHAHVRRKFADIVKSQKGNGSVEVAGEVIKRYKSIFKADSDIRKECGNEYILIRDKRETVIRPKLDELFTYLEGIINQVSEKSELYKAIQYARTNKEQLYTFQEGGRLELANNLSERSQKPVIIGRKNSMFMGSAR
ncbi:IS66 family transposase [[Clostridium] innocuum]|uniref:IS66 family transposase n=1 Tax=Clostridium innocuum TaxID=1522 RepID=UPI0032576636